MIRGGLLRPYAWLGLAATLLLASCGGESSVSGGVPTDNNGPTISGTVSMPNGQVAAAPSALERLAAAVVARVEALVSGTVRPVGAGVEVRVREIGPQNISGGRITGGRVTFRGSTGAGGAYAIKLPTGTSPETCRYILEVGSGSTLTRAFVDDLLVDIDFESEAAVRLVLDEIRRKTTTLCGLDAGDLHGIRRAVMQSTREVFGDSASAVNAAATAAAASDPGVQSAISIALGAPTPAPTSTHTVPPTLTATAVPTATRTVPPTQTVPPTATSTRAPTRTATNTVPPTRTDTPAPTNTATTVPTNTSVPTSTLTPVPTATFTTAPSNTPVPTNTATAVPTNTRPTDTAIPTPTATPQASSVDIGAVAGNAGAEVEVPVTFTNRGGAIAALSTDIEYDGDALAVVTNGGKPACTIDGRLAGSKQVVASVGTVGGEAQRLRIGVIGLDNNQLITSGVLFRCRFRIAIDAPATITLVNTSEAASDQAAPVAVVGSDGRIDVTASAAALGLVAGTAAAGSVTTVTARLVSSGTTLAAVATDIRFDAAALEADGGSPCAVTAAAAAAGKTLLYASLPADGAQRAGVRIGVIDRGGAAALPDGAVFTCRFHVLATSGSISLTHQPEGATPEAAPVALAGAPGAIEVVP
ncbi:MAG: cohesin domain-containing protein [Deltaproteobacteria bacterium]|nr:cohesin domain-containing protein [Deltaproteobacteria bacterium]